MIRDRKKKFGRRSPDTGKKIKFNETNEQSNRLRKIILVVDLSRDNLSKGEIFVPNVNLCSSINPILLRDFWNKVKHCSRLFLIFSPMLIFWEETIKRI